MQHPLSIAFASRLLEVLDESDGARAARVRLELERELVALLELVRAAPGARRNARAR